MMVSGKDGSTWQAKRLKPTRSDWFNKIKAETKKSGRVFMHDKTGSKEDFSKSCLLFHLGNTPE